MDLKGGINRYGEDDKATIEKIDKQGLKLKLTFHLRVVVVAPASFILGIVVFISSGRCIVILAPAPASIVSVIIPLIRRSIRYHLLVRWMIDRNLGLIVLLCGGFSSQPIAYFLMNLGCGSSMGSLIIVLIDVLIIIDNLGFLALDLGTIKPNGDGR